MPWGFAAAAVGTVVGSVISSEGAQSAADTQAQATQQASKEQLQAQQQALDFQKQSLDESRKINQPFVDTGTAAMYQLADLLGVNVPGHAASGQTPEQILSQTPGYQFGLQQGQRAVESSAAARGMQLSGANLKALDRYGQDYAGTNFQQYLNNLSGLTNVGLSGANMTGSAITAAGANSANIVQNTGNNIASNIIGAGNAQAAGQVASSNAINQGLQNISGSLGQYFGNVQNTTPSTGFTLNPNVGSLDLSGTTYGSYL